MDEIKIENLNLSDICWFCLNQCSDLKSISEVQEVSADTFGAFIGIESTDELPQMICVSCTDIFQTFFTFIEKSKDNINKLITFYQRTQQKPQFDISDSEGCDWDSRNLNEEILSQNENETVIDEKCVNIKSIKNNKKHVGTENNQKRTASFKCDRCRKSFTKEKLLEKHKVTGKCNYMESKIKSKIGDKGCKKRISIPNVITCKNCKLTFNKQEDLTIHCQDGVTCQPMDFKCSECNKVFKMQHRLNNHMRSHRKEAPFECTECKKAFKFQHNLKRHILIHQGVKKFKCDDCGKAFSRSHVLNEHRNIHIGQNPYICDYCGRGFKRYANHFIHVYRHKLLNGEVDQTKDKKLYLQLQCNICDKIFASRGGLENHLTLHQEEPRQKKFLCTECGKGFNTKAQLQSHMKTHSDDRPFGCNLCGKRFKQKSAFSNHKLVHSGEKPYQCNVCERFFSQSGHLKIHMRVHSGEKPFACNLCGKEFALKSNLTVHTRTHTGEKPFVCSVCDNRYYESTSLKRHMKAHEVGLSRQDHGNEDNNNPSEDTDS